MKSRLLHLSLVVSVVANIGLCLGVIQLGKGTELGKRKGHPLVESASQVPKQLDTSAQLSGGKNATSDYNTLQKLGLSEEDARRIVIDAIKEPRRNLERKLRILRANEVNQAYKGDGRPHLTAADYEELRKLRKRERAEIDMLFGSGAEVFAEERDRYPYLDNIKIQGIVRLREDFNELLEAEQQEMFLDQKKIRELEKTQRNQVSNMLSPAENLEYQRRESRDALQLADMLRGTGLTKDQFDRIFDDSLHASVHVFERQNVMAAAKKMLPDATYQSIKSNLRPEIRQLREIKDLLGISSSEFAELHSSVLKLPEELSALFSQGTFETRQAGVKLIETRITRIFQNSLGPEYTQGYFSGNAGGWMDRMRHGIYTSVDDDGMYLTVTGGMQKELNR